PERVDRLVAGGDEPVPPAGGPDGVPETQTELGRAVELPAELPHVRDPDRETGHRPERQLLARHVREGPAPEIRLRQRLEQLPGGGPPDTEACELARDVGDV